jgi:hypothetical protein
MFFRVEKPLFSAENPRDCCFVQSSLSDDRRAAGITGKNASVRPPRSARVSYDGQTASSAEGKTVVKRVSELSFGELAAHIASHLWGRGIEVVLSGGSCETTHSAGKDVSIDLEFIDPCFATQREFKETMAEISYIPENRYFKHPETDLLVELPSHPPAIRKELIGVINEIGLFGGRNA